MDYIIFLTSFTILILFLLIRSPLWLSFILVSLYIAFMKKGLEGLSTLAYNVFSDKMFFELALITFLIGLFVSLYRLTRFVEGLGEGVKKLFGNPLIGIAVIPASLGVLSIPGGALMSAPIVDVLGNRVGLDKPKKIYANVWFRHVIFLVYPLSTFLIFFSYLTNIDLWILVARQTPLMLYMVLVGYILTRLGVKHDKSSLGEVSEPTTEVVRRDHYLLMKYASPILAAIIVSLALSKFTDYRYDFLPINRLSMIIGVTLGILLLLYLSRSGKKVVVGILRNRSIWELVLIVSTAIVLRKAFSLLDISSITGYGLSSIDPAIVSAIIPFVFAYAVGMHMTGALLAIPIVQSITSITPTIASLVYVASFLGYLISPLHLCLIYTAKYFETPITKSYKYLVPSALSTLIIALLINKIM